ncbi:hypothetical protein H8356DRAFT_1340432 [Neocallimastix lanati (nom. inval.)]|nr:hypothetical protein H8356DRAFT_1340432 [Neocallimastix sp. JGI-2020a]
MKVLDSLLLILVSIFNIHYLNIFKMMTIQKQGIMSLLSLSINNYTSYSVIYTMMILFNNLCIFSKGNPKRIFDISKCVAIVVKIKFQKVQLYTYLGTPYDNTLTLKPIIVTIRDKARSHIITIEVF